MISCQALHTLDAVEDVTPRLSVVRLTVELFPSPLQNAGLWAGEEWEKKRFQASLRLLVA